jgi:hypothetical protein
MENHNMYRLCCTAACSNDPRQQKKLKLLLLTYDDAADLCPSWRTMEIDHGDENPPATFQEGILDHIVVNHYHRQEKILFRNVAE